VVVPAPSAAARSTRQAATPQPPPEAAGPGEARAESPDPGEPAEAVHSAAGAAAPSGRTPLLERHRAAGAKLIAFAGFDMPLHYPPRESAAPVREEHIAVRSRCGLFDVSHMGQIEVAGPHAADLLQRLLSNDVERMQLGATPARPGPGAAQYSVLCSEEGGVLDDLIAYRLGPERYLVVTNAARHASDVDWFRAHARGLEVEVRDARADYAMLALQGPAARELLRPLAELELPARMRAAEGLVAGVGALVCGTGYTGEDGVELLVAPRQAGALWDALVAHGARPAGLAARDTLRLEACLPLYGNELTTARSPIAAGLGWCCREATRFVGAPAVRAVREAGPAERLVAFRLAEPGIARAGSAVAGGGEVTSGALSPCLGAGIGLAYVPSARAAPGTALEIDVRGRPRRATVVEKPFVTGSSSAGPRPSRGDRRDAVLTDRRAAS
jgi:aminomethyltransferase